MNNTVTVVAGEETINAKVMEVTGLTEEQAWSLIANVGLKMYAFWCNGRVGAYGVKCTFSDGDVAEVRS